MVMKRKKVVRTEGIEIPEGNTEDLKESYKYLQNCIKPLGNMPTVLDY